MKHINAMTWAYCRALIIQNIIGFVGAFHMLRSLLPGHIYNEVVNHSTVLHFILRIAPIAANQTDL